MISLRWKDDWIKFISVQWSGTDSQCSREVAFTIPFNPYDKNFQKIDIRLGDLIYLYDGKKRLFLGTVTERSKEAAAGSASYTAKDFMHFLLRSRTTMKFKKASPEKITRQICGELGIGTSSLAKTKASVPSAWFEDQCIYDIIVEAYRKAKAKTKKRYMPIMDGKKVSVIEKGKDSGVALDQAADIISASYHDTTDNMVNIVRIYDEKKKLVGKVQDKKDVKAYGTYQQGYTKEEGIDAKKAALSMLTGVTKEASVEAIGDIRAVSGRSLEIRDRATGLSGRFYIQGDTHTFENGVHTMSLELAWSASGGEGDVDAEDKGKKPVSNKARAYYLDGSSVYHSGKSCAACKGKRNIKSSTVAEMKKIKVANGKNKGRRKYKPCARCWLT